MITFEGLEENFKFLTLEVQKQVRSAVAFLDAPSHELYDKIISRDDYIDSLKTIIENKCYSQIHTGGKPLTEGALHRIRAIQVISVNLERIADFCVNIVRQIGYLTDPAFLHNYDHAQMFTEIERCIAHILDVLESANLSGALSICKSEYQLDMLYKTIFDRIMDELRSGQNVQNLITVLFIFRYLERIGDSLLNIGEALMFVIIGERIKIEQFEALQQTLTKTGFQGGMKDVDFKSIMGTRSGCRIGKVDQKSSQHVFPEAFGCIYKEGALPKISAERDNLARWSAVFPGLVANIVSYNEDGDKASMLVEFLPGCNFDELALSGDEEVLQNAMFVLTQTAKTTWEETLDPSPIPVNSMKQLRSRLENILQIHPYFAQQRRAIGDTSILAMEELLHAGEVLEAKVQAPFSVFIHGDFNTSNFIYNHAQQRVHYIDVYRSKQYDYVQDVSVFLLSNFRIPIFETHIRDRLDRVIEEFYLFAREFAASKQDASFDYRLALALARSFATSTRFELNRLFAREMFDRARYLLEKLLRHADRPIETFELPSAILYY